MKFQLHITKESIDKLQECIKIKKKLTKEGCSRWKSPKNPKLEQNWPLGGAQTVSAAAPHIEKMRKRRIYRVSYPAKIRSIDFKIDRSILKSIDLLNIRSIYFFSTSENPAFLRIFALKIVIFLLLPCKMQKH
jgi:hypothetical protein